MGYIESFWNPCYGPKDLDIAVFFSPLSSSSESQLYTTAIINRCTPFNTSADVAE